MQLISLLELKNRFTYNPVTGVWIRNYDNSIAGTTNPQGYIIINIDHKLYRAHRLAWLYMTGEWPNFDIDHKNTIKSDNSWDNLRAANKSNNGANRYKQKNNTSGIKGVIWDKQTNRWRAKIKVRGKHLCLGRFDKIEDAAKAYENAINLYFNEFART